MESFFVISGFFAILHSWLNAFAEMLRFADRMFYKVRITEPSLDLKWICLIFLSAIY